jgi:hypothetical protein
MYYLLDSRKNKIPYNVLLSIGFEKKLNFLQCFIDWIRERITFLTMHYLLDSRKNKISDNVLSIGFEKE